MSKEPELWSLDRAENTATHQNGLKLEIREGAVVDIKHVPKGLKTKDIDTLSREAECLWSTPHQEKKKRPVVIIKKRRRIAPQ